MPTRILREGIITSAQINQLSDRAELFYRRLMSVADDYGRFYSHPTILRAQCYPLKLQNYSDEDVKQMLSECVAAGLILLYGPTKNYLHIVKFNQQTRTRSKFPEPSGDELLIICKADGKQMFSLGEGGAEGEGEDAAGAGSRFTSDFKTGWCLRYETAFRRKYQFQGVKDGAAVAALAKSGSSSEELLELASKAWRSNDPFTRSVSVTIAGFKSRLNNIQAEFAPKEKQSVAKGYRV